MAVGLMLLRVGWDVVPRHEPYLCRQVPGHCAGVEILGVGLGNTHPSLPAGVLVCAELG
jgi:hypothetical protein